METTAALLLPLIASVASVYLCTRERETRRAVQLFAVLVAVWLAPAWVRMQTPASLDFLRDAPPLRTSASYLQKNLVLNDVPLQMLPWREATVRCWRAGELPLLDRSAASGSPLWLNLQAAVLYPPNLASLPFSTFAWPLFYAASKLMIALVGMYLFLRSLSRSHAASIFGAIAYAFSVFSIAFLLFPHTSVTTLLPLFLFFLKRRADGRMIAAPSAALVLFVMFTGGHPESLLHCALVAIPFAALLLYESADRLRLSRDFALVGIIALCLASPLIIPFAAYLPHTIRVSDLRNIGNFLATPPFSLPTFFTALVPNYLGNPRIHNYRGDFNFNEVATWFSGLSTLALAVGAIVAAPRKHRFWGSLLLMSVALSTEPLWLQRIVRHIRLLDVSANGRMRFAVVFILAVLAAAGLDLLRDERARRRIAHVAMIVLSLTIAICIGSYPIFAQFGIRRLIFFTELAALGGVALIAISARFPRAAAPAVLTTLLFLDLFGVVGFYNPANPRELFYPRTPAIDALRAASTPRVRISGVDRALQPNQAVFQELEDIRPHDPVAFAPYVHFLDRAGLDRSTYFEKFTSAPKPLLNFLGVRAVIAAPDGPAIDLPVAYRGSDAVVYRNDAAMPRYFIPSAVIASRDPVSDSLSAATADRVFAASSFPVASAKITLDRYAPSSTRLRIETSSASFVASSEVALPGWRLERNGNSWPLVPINGTFLGWRVPSGSSTFELRYRPPYLEAGTAVGLIGVALLGGWFVASNRRRKESDSSA